MRIPRMLREIQDEGGASNGEEIKERGTDRSGGRRVSRRLQELAKDGKRKRYDETKRRASKRKKQGTAQWVWGQAKAGPLKYLIVLGKRAIDAMAKDREWRDGSYRRKRRRRRDGEAFDDGG